MLTHREDCWGIQGQGWGICGSWLSFVRDEMWTRREERMRHSPLGPAGSCTRIHLGRNLITVNIHIYILRLSYHLMYLEFFFHCEQFSNLWLGVMTLLWNTIVSFFIALWLSLLLIVTSMKGASHNWAGVSCDHNAICSGHMGRISRKCLPCLSDHSWLRFTLDNNQR